MNTQQNSIYQPQYSNNQPKLTAEQYNEAIERRYNGEKLSVIASDLGVSVQALSKRFIKDKVIPAKAKAYPVASVLDNMNIPLDPKNINIYRNLTSKEIAKITDKLALFSFKDATNKQIMSFKIFHHLCRMLDGIENGKLYSYDYYTDVMNLAIKFLSSHPMGSSNEIIKNMNQYLKSMFKADQTVTNGFANDSSVSANMNKMQKLSDYVDSLQEQ